ncbi:MAG: C1 family peptidase [Clostridiaceae bacterium]|nr:C1 family peptidase [Clostridiaceae bacterium]
MITPAMLNAFQERFNADPVNSVVAGAIARVGINEASLDNTAIRVHDGVFSDITERGEITNQKSSGRCWMFAALNTLRVDVMRKLNLKTFEFSQNYMFFWDKLEKTNFFYNSILDTLDEPLNSRLVQHLLAAPLGDGGQWAMFSGLLEKYGAVPKAFMPETFHSSNSGMMVYQLTYRLRAQAKQLRDAHNAGAGKDELNKMKTEFLYDIYAILVKALGQPPTRFTYTYRDKDDKFHRMSDITPQEFFAQAVGWNLADKVSLINAPTADKPYGRVYTIKYLGSVAEAEIIKYINVPTEVIREAAIAAIRDGEPVWFGCDVGKFLERSMGIMDLDIFNFEQTLGTIPEFDKAARLDYGHSLLTHAMVFTGVDLDENGKPIKWQVENSWGDQVGLKGMYSMADSWFDEYMYQIMIDRKYVPAEWLAALDQPIIELEPWDPMGSLANMR